MKNNALELFSAIPKTHNCAQAVACGLGHTGRKDELSSCGGGRAPDGVCGALYSAMLLVPEENRETVCQAFVKEHSSMFCRDLKSALVPCACCVETAAALAEKYGALKEKE